MPFNPFSRKSQDSSTSSMDRSKELPPRPLSTVTESDAQRTSIGQADNHTIDSRTGDTEANALHQDTTQSERAFVRQLPTLKEFFLDTWEDLVPMVIVAAVSIPIMSAAPAHNRLFPITWPDSGQVVYPELAHPYREQIIPVWLSAVLGVFIPFIFFVLAQLRLKSYDDLHAATFGLLWTLVNSTFIQVTSKTLIGGLRPYFYDACKPVFTPGTGTGFQNMMYDRSVCTGDKKEINKSLQSWPSGHANAAAGTLFFLSLYINAKLKVFSNTRSRYWKMFLFFLPLLGAALLCTVLTVDQSHHWYDVLSGVIIGVANALAAFRMAYASVWDFRFNHIPLPRTRSSFPFLRRNKDSAEPRVPLKEAQRFDYQVGPGAITNEYPVLTRRWPGIVHGAPGDGFPVQDFGGADRSQWHTSDQLNPDISYRSPQMSRFSESGVHDHPSSYSRKEGVSFAI